MGGMKYSQEHGPFGAALDKLARETGGWKDSEMVYSLRVLGDLDRGDPQVLLTGSEASWMPRAKRWKFYGPASHTVVRLSDYRAAIGQNP